MRSLAVFERRNLGAPNMDLANCLFSRPKSRSRRCPSGFLQPFWSCPLPRVRFATLGFEISTPSGFLRTFWACVLPRVAQRTLGKYTRHPLPTKGIFVAMTVMNKTFASRGKLAM